MTDFHSAADAARAAAEFTRVVRRKELPSEIPAVALPAEIKLDDGIRLDKLLARIGLADSVSDAGRKLKAGSVHINGERVQDFTIPVPQEDMVIQAGKNWRRVTV